jgi:glycosyltransferase involved in cell wall biosynthesis
VVKIEKGVGDLSARVTIGIPTYNRSSLLETCLSSIDLVLNNLDGQIDLLVSDNFSSDETQLVIREFAKNRGQSYQFRSIRQLENVGAVPNIFALIESCRTDYLIFLGDDDEVSLEGLQHLLKRINDLPPSHFVEGSWPWRRISEEMSISPAQAGEWGYEIGLAWSSVYNVAACQNALGITGLKAQLGKSIWGQIGLALTSIHVSKLGVRVMPFSWGSVAQERPYRYGYDNLLLSLRDLVRTHRDAARATGNSELLARFLTIRNFGYRSHLLGILVESAAMKKSDLLNEVWDDLLKDSSEISKPIHKINLSFLRIVCLSRLRFLVAPIRFGARTVRRLKFSS